MEDCFAKPRNDKLIFISAITIICVVVTGVYLFRPDLFHFAISYFQRRSIWHLLWLLFTKRIYIVQIAFAGAFVAFLIAYWKNSFFKVVLRQASSDAKALADRQNDNAEAWKGWKWLAPIFGVALAIVIFHPNFPAQDGFANYIAGPAFEATQGRPLLFETFSLYGILNTYLVAFLFKLGLPATFKSLTLVIMAGYGVFFFLLYRFLKTWFNSRLFAVIGTWASVVLGFFLLTDPYVTAYEFVGQTAYRQGFFIVPALFVAMFWKNCISSGRGVLQYVPTNRRIFKELALLSSAVGLFWNTETGVYTIIATCAVFGYWELIQLYSPPLAKGRNKEGFLFRYLPLVSSFERRRQEVLRRIAALGLRQLGYIALVFGIISLGNYFVFHEFPHWTQQLKLMTMFESGYGKLPLPAFGLFELHVFVYLGFLVWVVSTLRVGARLIAPLPVVFLAVYGQFALLYYVGNSAWSYLNFVSIPMVLLAVYGFRIRVGAQDVVPLQKRLMSAGFTAFLTFFLILTLAKIPVAFAGRDYTDINLNSPEPKFADLYQDAQELKHLTPEKAVPVLHEDDGRLLLWAGKVNYFHLTVNGEVLTSVYDDAQIVYQHQVRDFVGQLERDKPQYVIVANKYDARFQDFVSQIQGSYGLVKSLNTLNIYERL